MKMSGKPDVYFNENDKFPSQWLRNLFPQAHIDERDIRDVKPADVAGFRRCHFFGGIGGWEYALQLAGWPSEWEVWTGSCPCQPFANQGRKQGFSDSRHLWPAWFSLIRQRRPVFVFGEQVAGAIKFGWLDNLFADMESEGYACGATVLGAHSVGAPHIRQRAYWMAYSPGPRRWWRQTMEKWDCKESGRSSEIICAGSWPDDGGGKSTLRVSDVLSPSHGVPKRMGRLRGYGNAIVPQVATVFIQCAMEIINESIS